VLTDRSLAARVTPERLAVRAQDVRVHEPERRRRESGKHGRMPSNGFGDALAALQAASDKLPRVAAVALRTRRADGFAAVAARLSEDPVRLALGGPDLPPMAVAIADIDAAL